MSVSWLQPAAAWGLAAVAVPILIHLLVRQRTRRMPFPSLRFLHPTRLASLRRRSLSEVPLLIIRALTVAAAVAALAAPVFVTAARRQAWSQRTARAIVVAASSALQAEIDRVVAAERSGSFASAVFTGVPGPAPGGRSNAGVPLPVAVMAGDLADSVRDAVSWLERQPPGLREIVVVGDPRVGALEYADTAAIPSAMGLRFVPLPNADATAHRSLVAIADHGTAATAPFEIDVTVDARHTDVRYGGTPTLPAPPIEVRATAADQGHADAALAAVLAEGVLLGTHLDRRVIIVFNGVDGFDANALTSPAPDVWMRTTLERLPSIRGGARQGRLVVLAGVAASDPGVAPLIARVAQAAFDQSRENPEPNPIARELLSQWSRPSRPVSSGVPIPDEGDRRWLWGVVLALMAIEHVVRRDPPRRATTRKRDQNHPEVARVA